MSYQVLARKWRPHTFQTMIGQEHVLRALMNALDKNRLHHAYLFTGTRGVGKTTVARIFAKSLNCEQGISATPCGKCSACLEIDDGRFVDLIEVDAASRTKVEDTRDLLDNVPYAPTRGRYKIYLIDEVHMLSGHSFNALLKTLEEPPEHVKFLLATTDPQKLPVTILSRCLQFNLKPLSTDAISAYLKTILIDEQIPFDEEALLRIAAAAHGSVRDALSLLDQAIAFTQSNINAQDIHALLGTIEKNHIESILQALADANGQQLLQLSRQLSEQGMDFKQALEELISAFHQIAMTQVVPEAVTDAHIKSLATNFTKEEIQLYYQISLIGRRDLPLAPDAKTGFEMTLLRLLAFKPAATKNPDPKKNEPPISPPKMRVEPKKITPEKEKSPPAPTHSEKWVDKPLEKTTLKEPLVSVEPEEIKTVQWDELLPQLKLTGLTYELASNCAFKSFQGNRFELILSANHAALFNEKMQLRIAEALTKNLSQPIKLTIHIGSTAQETPAEKAKKTSKEQHEAAVQSVQNDFNVQTLIEKLSVSLDPALIEAVE